MLGAARDDDFVTGIIKSLVPLEFGDDGVPRFQGPGDGSVLGHPVVECLDGGLLDIVRSIEIGLTGSEPDHVLAIGLHLLGFCCDGKCG